ncbi:unnamed protein product, partial [Pylaiella littoralis]
MLSTPEKDEGGPRTRSHTTPTTSDRALESDRCAPRPRVWTPASIATLEFGFLCWDEPNSLTSMLPVCLWLKHHKRSGKVKTGTSAQAFVWVREWLATSEYAGIVGFDTTPYSIGHIFVRLLKHKNYFCLDVAGMQKKAKVYSIQSCEWGDTYIDLFKSLPLQWSATRLPDTSMVFSRDDQGAIVKVTVEKPDLGGRGSVKSITL